jgi:hypothetical protein
MCSDHSGAISKSLHSVHAIPYGEQLSFLVISMTLSPFCCGLFHAAGKMKKYDGSPVKLIQIESGLAR